MKISIGSDEWEKTLETGAEDLNIVLTKKIMDDLALYATELLRWNQKKNLTTITDEKEIAIKHFLDSLYPVHVIKPEAVILDIGTGAGFPGIPLKLMLPETDITVIDASRKKISFVKHIIRKLNLKKIEAKHIRAEDLAKTEPCQHAFDVVTSRALSSLELFIKLSSPFLKEDGMMVALKSNVYEKESAFMQRIQEEGDVFEGETINMKVLPYELPFLKAYRTLVIIKKEKITDNEV